MSTNVERVRKEIKTLSPVELEEVKQIVDELLTAQAQRDDKTLQQMLHDAGLLREIKAPRRDAVSFRNYQPIPIKGKPVSETIVEERR